MVIRLGKVQVLNVVEQTITCLHLRTLKRDTIVVLVFDTDIFFRNILKCDLAGSDHNLL